MKFLGALGSTLAVAIFLAGAASAAPVINGCSGTFTEGQPCTISGSGFGSKPTGAPIKFDDFENGANGSPLSGWVTYSGGNAPPQYDTHYLRSRSSCSARANYAGQYNQFGIQSPTDISQIYIDFWYLYDPASPPSRNHKLFRFYADQDQGFPNLYTNIYCDSTGGDHLTQDGVDVGNYHKYFEWGWRHAVKKWVHVQGYFKASSTTADDGQARLWIDGVPFVNELAFRTRTTTNSMLWHSVWFGYWLGHESSQYCSASPGASYTYWDDVYVDYTQARIEVGNASTYATCTHREVQIPTAWATNSIAISVNGGSFDPGSGLYLYVTDPTGAVNAVGYPVSLGDQTGADSTPPNAVSNLAVGSTTQTSAALTWTAVGDDGNTGTATTYDLRYSTSTITSGNWGSATQVSGEPAPRAAGQAESFTVSGLTAGTTYYFALKVADEVPNWSGLSNVPSGTTQPPSDTTAPNAVSNLAVGSTTQTSAALTWTAVGDDGNTGTATTYDLRYSTSTITSGNWGSATQVSGEPAPRAAGQAESFTVSGLTAGTTYYFALKVADEVPNWSGLSNVPSGTTQPPSDTTAPNAVSNLAVGSTTQTSAALTWAAVGDDGNTGTATTYDLRYSTSTITSANWGSATQVSGEPAPRAAGQAESFTVSGLTAGTTYYFALKVADEVPNWSGLSNVPSGTTQPPSDTTAPNAVSNLAVGSTTQTSAALTWTAVGDDGNTGTATTYDLRYSTSTITSANWGSATQVSGEPAPRAAGQAESFTVSGLTAGTTYYFALKVADEVPNWSGLSNVPSGTTQPPSGSPDECPTAPPAWVFCSGFEEGNLNLWDDWDGNPPETNTILEDPGPADIPGNHVVRLRVPPGAGTADLVKVLPTGYDRLYARWYVKWEPGYDFNAANHGSGLHAGSRNYLGGSGHRPTGDDWFSGWIEPQTFNHRMAVYTYYRGMYQDCVDPNGSCWGDDFPCMTDEGQTYCTKPQHRETVAPPVMETDRWYCIEMMMDGGDPSANGNGANGILDFWIDGVEYGPWNDLWLRTTANLKLDVLWLSLFHPGAHSVAGLLIDNVVVSTQRVWPLGTQTDGTAPAAVTNLATGSTTQTSATLNWTAVGDDGNTGTATTYDLRYSTSTITSANWGSATQVSGEPAPRAAGQAESFTVSGLTAGTTYYFALKVADEVPNWSGLSNVPSGTTQPPSDTTAPNAVSNLAVGSTTQTSAALTWTAVGDDGNTGTATTYDLRYSTSTITSGNWGSATQVSGEPAPRAAGQAESFTVSGLTAGTTYYFALKVADEVPNWSGLSNVPSGTTQPPSDTTAPNAVSNLAVGSTTQTSAALTWTAVGDDGNTGTATTYDLRYSTSTITSANWGSATQVSGEPAPRAAGQAESFTVSGLTAGTTYYFALKVADEVPNWSGLSNVPSGTTQPPSDTTAPNAVSNLAVGSTTQTSAALTWTAVGDDGNTGTATTYDLRYSTSTITSGNWGSATQVSGEPAPRAAGQAESFTVSGLTAGTTYYFALKVADEVPNWSGLSNVPSGTTQPPSDTTAPNAVSNLAVGSTTQTSAALTWTAVGDDGNTGTATTYDLRYSTSTITSGNWGSATQVSGEPAPRAAGQAESFTVSGLTAGTTYYFALKVADEVPNWSGLSNVPSGTTQPPSDTTAPNAVSNLAVGSTTQTSAALTWTAVGDDGNTGTATTYDLRYSTSTITSANWGSATQVSGEPAPRAAGQAESFTVSGLTAGTTYYFALKVADEVPNWSGLSNVPSGTTQPPSDTTAPNAVSNLAVGSTTQTSAALTWTAVGDDGNTGTATTYDLRYSTSTITSANWGSATQVSGEPAPRAAGQAESFTVSGLTAGTTYYFALKVADEVPNWSGLSNVPSGTTQPPSDTTAPNAVSNLAVGSTTQTSAALTWTAVGDDGNTGTATTYDLRYSTSTITSGNWGSATQVSGEPAPRAAGQAESFTVSGLTAGTTYYFALKVADEVPNWSGLSNVPSGTTQPRAPVANFVGSPRIGVGPLTVGFTDRSTNSPTSWSWTFGDGATSTQQNPSHVYTIAGRYSVSLTAANGGGSDGETKSRYIAVLKSGHNRIHGSEILVSHTDEDPPRGIATVTIVDGNDEPVPDATVRGLFNASPSMAAQGVTNAAGVATFTSRPSQAPVSGWCFEISDIVVEDGTYDPSLNSVGSKCEISTPIQSQPAPILLFELAQNQPNPFRTETLIVFHLPSAGSARLDVFGPDGKLVATLLDGYADAGERSCVWRSEGRAAGTYFLRLNFSGQVATRRMTVIR